MKKIVVIILTFCIIVSNSHFNTSASEASNVEILLKKCGIDSSKIVRRDSGVYTVYYGNTVENIQINKIGNDSIDFDVSDGQLRNTIQYNDDKLIIDGNLIEVKDNQNFTITPYATIWKGKKSLKPYGKLKAGDYNKYLSSGKQNVQLGKALDQLTVTALTSCISQFHGYIGLATKLATLAAGVKSTLAKVSPKTKSLGCKYTTYTHGAFDYKYINKFYANAKCTGKYKQELSYEHFTVY